MDQPHTHSHAHDDRGHTPTDFGDPRLAESWERRYAGGQVWSGNPNQALEVEVAALAASGIALGTALDIGCGEGADSVWLARQGWQVVALDISSNAVARTVRAAEDAGLHVTGMAQPFLTAPLAQPFGLVSAMFPVLEKTPEQLAEKKLLSLVAPGGHLLFVHHADVDADQARSHGFDAAAFLAVDDIAALVEADPAWEIVCRERRERHVATGGGAGHSVDDVLHARRTG